MTDIKYRLTVHHSEADNPMEDDTVFKLHMFSPKLIGYTDPDELLGRVPKGWFVSYFEHGLCRYGLEGTMSGMPDFRWDGTSKAGFLEIAEESEWWNSMSEAEQRCVAIDTLDYYTDWANNNIFGYVIETVVLDEDGETEADEHLDSCGGFIGADHFAAEVREMLPEDATPDNTEVVDNAWGAADFMDLFPAPIPALADVLLPA